MAVRRLVAIASALLLLVLLGLYIGGSGDEPPTDACAVARAEPGNRVAAAACRALGPFVRMELTSPLDLLLSDVTARRFGVTNIFDPKQNIEAGITYLSWLVEQFPNDLSKVLAAYNAGENAVWRYNGIPPYRETREYVRRIIERYDDYRQQ
jgi:hypothetical protein